jgi:hypothetical protein
METVGFIGMAAALLCAGVILVSFSTGRVPARWPRSSIDRRSAPIGFWIMIFVYATGAIMGALAASKFIY